MRHPGSFLVFFLVVTIARGLEGATLTAGRLELSEGAVQVDVRGRLAPEERGVPEAVRIQVGSHVESISLERFAEKLGFSPRHASRLFRQELGCTFSDYTVRLRIDRAKRLLSSTSHSVTEIAMVVLASAAGSAIDHHRAGVAEADRQPEDPREAVPGRRPVAPAVHGAVLV